MNLELKIPPVLQVLITAVVMWAIDRVVPVFVFAVPFPAIVLGLMGALGAGLALLAVMAFRRSSTTVDPRYPEQTSSLVISGVYQWTRNPMYLGMLIALFAWGVYLGSGSSFIAVLAFVAYMTRFQIMPEERLMVKKFGEPYTRYQQNVRRWI